MNPLPCCAALAASLVLLSGCASPYRTALSPGASGALGSTTGIVTTEQHEIGTTIRPSTGGGIAVGGLIGALVDSAANATSAGRMEKAVAELRQAMLGFEYENVFTETVAERFAVGPDLVVTPVVLQRDKNVKALGAIVKGAGGDAVMVVFLNYVMSPDFAHVVVSADTLLCARSDALAKQATAQTYGSASVPVLYRNRFQSTWTLPPEIAVVDGSREGMAAAWSTDGATPARNVLALAASELATMIAWDLAQPAAKDYRPRKGEATFVSLYRGGAELQSSGATAKTGPGRRWIRLTDGCLSALPH